MDTDSLYSISPGLRDLVCAAATRMVAQVEPPAALAEYIVLPDFGQRVILRFGPASDLKLSFAQADELESALRSLAGPDYWVTLTGDFYQNVLPDLGQRLINIDQKIWPDVLQYSPTCHSEPIRADAQAIREALSLADADRIWEIEVSISESAAEPIIRIIAAPQEGERAQPAPEHVQIGGVDFAVEYMRDDPSFAGCVKAYLMAERQYMALNSYIAQF